MSHRASFLENLKTASSVGHESEVSLGEALLNENFTVAIFLIMVGVVLIPLKNTGKNTGEISASASASASSSSSASSSLGLIESVERYLYSLFSSAFKS